MTAESAGSGVALPISGIRRRVRAAAVVQAALAVSWLCTAYVSWRGSDDTIDGAQSGARMVGHVMAVVMLVVAGGALVAAWKFVHGSLQALRASVVLETYGLLSAVAGEAAFSGAPGHHAHLPTWYRWTHNAWLDLAGCLAACVLLYPVVLAARRAARGPAPVAPR